jgi:hypothetical protein
MFIVLGRVTDMMSVSNHSGGTMTRHGIRCEVCNKFITFGDKADDGMCVACAHLIEQQVDKRTTFYRRFFLLVMLAMLAAIFILIAKVSSADELYNYKVYGQNKQSGLMVAGHVWETDKQGNVLGKLWDEFEINDNCKGAWVGYGVAQVLCENGIEYVLEVVEGSKSHK